MVLWNRTQKHFYTIQADLWQGIRLQCSCGWSLNHATPWEAREMVDEANTHTWRTRLRIPEPVTEPIQPVTGSIKYPT